MSELYKTPETAPKDGSVFLALMGYPWLMPCTYNAHDDQWVVANLQMCPMEDGTVDSYFENEYYKINELKGWVALSKID